MIYTAFTAVLSSVVIAVAFTFFHIELSVLDTLLTYGSIIGLSLALSFILLVLTMLIDVAHPKLDWDNPAAAMKRNMNTMASMFVTMGVLGAIIAAGVLILPMMIQTLAVFTLVCILLAIPLWKWFLKFAKKVLFRQF